MNKRLIVYDCGNESPQDLFPENEGTLVFNARPMVHHCVGCFSCWLKTPGKCVISDRCDVLPSYIAQSGELILISPILYGGFSRCVKAVLDRSIGYMSPFFRIVNGEMHHQLKVQNPFSLKVHFYGDCDSGEQEIAGDLVKAVAINFGAGSCEIAFHDSFSSIKEAVL